jgi:hypothetical protein
VNTTMKIWFCEVWDGEIFWLTKGILH